MHQIRQSTATVSSQLFRLLPYFCQFIGTETEQDVAQTSLQVLLGVQLTYETS